LSLLDTLKAVLGLPKPLDPTDGGPFRLTRKAVEALDRLPAGRALHVQPVPVAGGWAMRAFEGDDTLVPEGAEMAIVVSEEDAARLHGIVLDHDGSRFVPTSPLTVVPHDTPNPDGRKFETDRLLARGRPQAFRTGEGDAPPLAERLLGLPGVRAVLFNLHTVTVERAPGTAWKSLDRAVEAQLREHLLLAGPLLDEPVVEHDDDLEAEVIRVLQETILPKVHRDGGDLQLVAVRDGVVQLHMLGACNSCPASQITLKAGAERLLEQALPGRVVAVEAV